MPKRERAKLTAAIRRRNKFLTEVVNFIEEFIVEKGVKVPSHSSSEYTAIWRLSNFEGFSFHAVFGETMFGGNTVRMWHHPGRELADTEIERYRRGADLVLEVHHQDAGLDFDTGNAEVKFFAEEKVWPTVILYLVRNKDKILAARERARKKEAADAHAHRAAEEESVQLVAKAARLGL